MKRLKLTGTSMGRWLSGRVVELDPRAPEIGDLVAYRVSGKLLVHRLWWKGREGFWIKDDIARMDLHCISEDAIEGRISNLGWKSKGILGLAYSFLSNALYTIKNHLQPK